MSEERFDRIETRLDRLETGQTALRADVQGLKGDVADLKGDVAGLKGDIVRLDDRVDTLDRHMHVLHEETIARIAALSEVPVATKADIKMVLDKMDDIVGHRIVPLEVAVRSLSRERKGRRSR
jgi:predicted nuclease with TOPRIM domain